MRDREYHDPETGLVVHTTSRRRTTHTVTATFATRDCGVDLVLSELRAVVEAAAELPSDAMVSMYVDRAWRTPERLCIEYIADEPMPGDHPTGVYDPADEWDRAYDREIDRANGVV